MWSGTQKTEELLFQAEAGDESAVNQLMGPVTFVERQIAHVWAASLCMVVFMFPLEYHLGLEPLELAPLLGVVAGMAFVIKAGILSGWFYCHAFVLFVTAIVMGYLPRLRDGDFWTGLSCLFLRFRSQILSPPSFDSGFDSN